MISKVDQQSLTYILVIILIILILFYIVKKYTCGYSQNNEMYEVDNSERVEGTINLEVERNGTYLKPKVIYGKSGDGKTTLTATIGGQITMTKENDRDVMKLPLTNITTNQNNNLKKHQPKILTLYKVMNPEHQFRGNEKIDDNLWLGSGLSYTSNLNARVYYLFTVTN